MPNLRLKKTILEVVENQLKANNSPCTKDIYEKLLKAGYSRSEAMDKIGAVVLDEIYDILQEGRSFDEEKYRKSLEEMLRQSLDYEDDYHIETEWEFSLCVRSNWLIILEKKMRVNGISSN